jgi:hypothetical protein
MPVLFWWLPSHGLARCQAVEADRVCAACAHYIQEAFHRIPASPRRCPAGGQQLASVATILADALDAYESYARSGKFEILDSAGARLGRIHEDLDGFVASLDSAWCHQTDATRLVDLAAAASAWSSS